MDIMDLENDEADIQEDRHDPLREFKEAFDGNDGSDSSDDDNCKPEAGSTDEPSSKMPRTRMLNDKYKDSKLKQRLAKFNEVKRNVDVKEIVEKLEQGPNTKVPKSRHGSKQLNQCTRDVEVAEVYSSRRIAEMSRRLGMKVGWSLDLTCADETDNELWDLNTPEKKSRVHSMLKKDKPFILIASLVCTPFRRLQ